MRARLGIWLLAGVVAVVPALVDATGADARSFDVVNDTRAGAVALPTGSTEVDLATANAETDASCAEVDADLWYRYEARGTVTVSAHALDAGADPVVEVISGNRVLGCNDDTDNATVDASLTFTASTTVLLRVAAAPESEGRVALHLASTAALTSTGAIFGVATDDVTHQPLPQICALISNQSPAGGGGTALTSATGAYRLDGLAPGEYKLHFYDCNFPETRDHYAPEDWPTLVTVGTGEVGPVSPELARGGVITGTVKAQDTPDGLPSVCVHAVGNDGRIFVSDTISFTESYRLTGLTGDKYTVTFEDCTYGLYAPEDATVSVQVRSVKTKNAVLRVGGIIEGLVTSEETGVPLSDIKVDVYDKTGTLVFPVWTNQSGAYRVTGLPTGSYDLHFAADDEAFVASEWWDDQPLRADADPVKVTMGKTKPGVDAALSAGGAINGTVRDASTGQPVKACITATSASREFRRFLVVPSGAYRIGGIVGDDVVVRFSACGSPSLMLATKWYDDAINVAAATPIAVDDGDELTGIDADLEPFGTYAGQAVVAGSGFPRVPAQNICASLYAPDGSLVDTTEQRGFSFPVFHFSFLNPRVYTLVVDDCGDADLYAPVTMPATPTPGNGAPIITIEMPPAPTTCHGQVPTVLGTSGPDKLRGTNGPDVIAGYGGDDTISALGGDDLVCGGTGNDKISGAAGNDTLDGQTGDDELSGGAGLDALTGGQGTDKCSVQGGGGTTATCEP